MFVISLVCEGKLQKTAVRGNANGAVELAQSWFYENRDEYAEDGYIIIDQQVKGEENNVLFAEIRFDQSPDEAKLYLNLSEDKKGNPIFSSKFVLLSKTLLVAFLEFGLVKLTEYLLEKNRNGKGGY
jgi:hypothetical protein